MSLKAYTRVLLRATEEHDAQIGTIVGELKNGVYMVEVDLEERDEDDEDGLVEVPEDQVSPLDD